MRKPRFELVTSGFIPESLTPRPRTKKIKTASEKIDLSRYLSHIAPTAVKWLKQPQKIYKTSPQISLPILRKGARDIRCLVQTVLLEREGLRITWCVFQVSADMKWCCIEHNINLWRSFSHKMKWINHTRLTETFHAFDDTSTPFFMM